MTQYVRAAPRSATPYVETDSIRVADLPDLGAVTDTSSIVGDVAGGTGRFSALAVKSYCGAATASGLPEAPSNDIPYGRQNGAWTPVLPEAPSNSVPYARMNATWTPVLSDAPTNSIPYARMNGAWTPVMGEAPLTGLAYGRVNGTWQQVMGLAGGVISGSMGVNGNVTVGGAVYTANLAMSQENGYAWNFYVAADTENHVQAHAPGWSEEFVAATGDRLWIGTGGTLMRLDPFGHLIVKEHIHAPAVWADATAGQFGFAAQTGGRIFQYSTGFYWAYTTATATLEWNVSNGPLWVMRATDHFCYNAQAAVGGVGAYINSSDRRGKEGIAPSTKGLAEVLQLQPVSFTRIDASTGAQEEIGFVAQDVQPILPEAVWTAGIPLRDGSGGLESAEPTLGLTSETITAILVNAIKELSARVEVLEAAAA